MSDNLRLHLANKIEHPAVLDPKDSKIVKVPARTETLFGMSNRVVELRMLDPETVNRLNSEAAKTAGENASGRDIYNAARMLYVYEMIVQVSAPTDNPIDPKLNWKKSSPNDFLIPGAWSKLFTAKDTAVLQAEYSKWHEVSSAVVEMLSGKALPVASGD